VALPSGSGRQCAAQEIDARAQLGRQQRAARIEQPDAADRLRAAKRAGDLTAQAPRRYTMTMLFLEKVYPCNVCFSWLR